MANLESKVEKRLNENIVERLSMIVPHDEITPKMVALCARTQNLFNGMVGTEIPAECYALIVALTETVTPSSKDSQNKKPSKPRKEESVNRDPLRAVEEALNRG